jgi:sigma-E factor negative regulatory protein RseA
MKEKLSALIDAELDELEERRFYGELQRDAELRQTWERYHLIRAAMTRQLGVLAAPGLPERVMAAIEANPQPVAKPLRFWPLASGFAAAASVAAIAILGLQALQNPTTPVVVAGPVATVPASTAAGVEESTPSAVVPSIEEKLNRYLVGHNEFMPTAGMGSMLPYVRVVTDNPDR